LYQPQLICSLWTVGLHAAHVGLVQEKKCTFWRLSWIHQPFVSQKSLTRPRLRRRLEETLAEYHPRFLPDRREEPALSGAERVDRRSRDEWAKLDFVSQKHERFCMDRNENRTFAAKTPNVLHNNLSRAH
jgi:hypothetical protein